MKLESVGSFSTTVLVTARRRIRRGSSAGAVVQVGPGGRALPCLSRLWFQAWQQTVKITEGHGVCSVTLPGKPHCRSAGQGT